MVAVTAVDRGSPSPLSADERQQERDAARDRQAMTDATVYAASLRANAEFDVNPQLLE